MEFTTLRQILSSQNSVRRELAYYKQDSEKDEGSLVQLLGIHLKRSYFENQDWCLGLALKPMNTFVKEFWWTRMHGICFFFFFFFALHRSWQFWLEQFLFHCILWEMWGSKLCSVLADCMYIVSHYRSIGFSNNALPLKSEILLDNVNTKHIVHHKWVSWNPTAAHKGNCSPRE